MTNESQGVANGGTVPQQVAPPQLAAQTAPPLQQPVEGVVTNPWGQAAIEAVEKQPKVDQSEAMQQKPERPNLPMQGETVEKKKGEMLQTASRPNLPMQKEVDSKTFKLGPNGPDPKKVPAVTEARIGEDGVKFNQVQSHREKIFRRKQAQREARLKADGVIAAMLEKAMAE